MGKATGPQKWDSRVAEATEILWNPWSTYLPRVFLFYDFVSLGKYKREEKEMKIIFVGAMAATFVLGFGFIPILVFLGRIVLAQAKANLR